MSIFKDKIIGSMIGLAIGDAFGAPYKSIDFYNEKRAELKDKQPNERDCS